METQLFDVRTFTEEEPRLAKALAEPARILAEGGTVAFPTETVYGLGANALDPAAVAKIYEAKGRPSDNPLIVHIADESQLSGIVREIPDMARKVFARWWPGSVSVILKRDPRIPDIVTAGLDTVGVRMPINPEARVLLRLCGCPVAAPSANLSGKPSPTRPEHVLHDLQGRVNGIVLGRNCDVGIESTVLDLSGDIPTILRPGIVTPEDLEPVIGPVRVASNRVKEDAVPRAPGMKYTHYAPDAPLILYDGAPEKVWQRLTQRAAQERDLGKRVGLILSAEHRAAAQPLFGNDPGVTVCSAGSSADLRQAAHEIFRILRDLDGKGVDIILGETVPETGVGFSVMNRLAKAAKEIITVR